MKTPALSWTFTDVMEQQLPLRATKTLLALSVDRVDRSTTAFQATCAIWEEGFPNILADLLRLLRYVLADAQDGGVAF
jgi:hypothetical protein